MSSQKKLLMTICYLLVVSMAAMAEDISPPSWRGHPESTVQEWDFLTAGPIDSHPPDGNSIITYNPYGEPYLGWMNYEPAYSPDTGPGPGGAWVFSAFATAVPSYPDQGGYYNYPVRAIRSQITFEISNDTPFTYSQSYVDLDLLYEEILPVPGHPDWAVLVQDWLYDDTGHGIEFSSPIVNLIVDCYGGPISEVVIDTIPEPATLLLLTLGTCLIRKPRV